MDTFYKGFIAVLGGFVGFLFGGWSILLTILSFLVIIDYGSGLAAAGVNGEMKSRVGFIGITRKVFIFVIVAVAHMIDLLLIESGIEMGFLVMTVTIVFYCINELISITENAGKMGVYVPEPITKAIEVLKQQNKSK
ncbi:MULTISPECIES: holin family protein [Bacillus]|uniref:Holin n=1 Tax=Bacillus glycinifermentans TaxID=1664069 RepID=A0AAJ4D3G9_9BACI|nr:MULTISPECIES: phage holin family protein [Bacillus]KKB73740.1 holin [Bacillus sp. TH008]MDU0073518.1 phage holin family protein [Bacillus sp. IG6]MED8021389.1 phage holin family protein [Bacillus glycinifermentans]QAT66525.1 holin [Bacillus glycinifermentans]WKB76261.1 phage holin family protein [Bacillus glycinifermentans]